MKCSQLSFIPKLAKQALASVLSLSLLGTSVNIAQAATLAPSIFVAPSDLPQFHLVPPQNLGRIVDYFNATLVSSEPQKASGPDRARRSPPLVILIQDLHAHYGVQKNIAGLLDFLGQKLQRSDSQMKDASSPPFALAVEGAEGPIDSSLMALFPDARVKEEASQFLMREGELTGAEYFAIQHGLPHFIVGAENGQLYALHRDLFRRTIDSRQAMVQALTSIQTDIASLPPRIYGPELKALQQKMDAFEKGELGTNEFIGFLVSQAPSASIDLQSFPALAAFSHNGGLTAGGAGVHFQELRNATAEFFTASAASLSLEEKKNLSILAKQTDSAVYYLYVRELIFKHQLFLAAPPELAAYLENLHTERTSGMDRVLHEANELAFKLKLQRARSKQEKDLVQVQHDLDLLKRLADLQATEAEVRDFAPQFNQFVALTGALLRGASSLSAHNPLPGLSFDEATIRRLISSSIDYYVLAMLRNKPMVDNTLALLGHSKLKPSSHPPDVAVLVAGGFHTIQITNLLRGKNISYLVIAPTVDQLTDADRELYIKRLSGKLLTEDEILTKLTAAEPDPNHKSLFGLRQAVAFFRPSQTQNHEGLAVGPVLNVETELEAIEGVEAHEQRVSPQRVLPRLREQVRQYLPQLSMDIARPALAWFQHQTLAPAETAPLTHSHTYFSALNTLVGAITWGVSMAASVLFPKGDKGDDDGDGENGNGKNAFGELLADVFKSDTMTSDSEQRTFLALQIISGLINLQPNTVVTRDQLKQAFTFVKNRVRSSSSYSFWLLLEEMDQQWETVDPDEIQNVLRSRIARAREESIQHMTSEIARIWKEDKKKSIRDFGDFKTLALSCPPKQYADILKPIEEADPDLISKIRLKIVSLKDLLDAVEQQFLLRIAQDVFARQDDMTIFHPSNPDHGSEEKNLQFVLLARAKDWNQAERTNLGGRLKIASQEHHLSHDQQVELMKIAAEQVALSMQTGVGHKMTGPQRQRQPLMPRGDEVVFRPAFPKNDLHYDWYTLALNIFRLRLGRDPSRFEQKAIIARLSALPSTGNTAPPSATGEIDAYASVLRQQSYTLEVGQKYDSVKLLITADENHLVIQVLNNPGSDDRAPKTLQSEVDVHDDARPVFVVFGRKFAESGKPETAKRIAHARERGARIELLNVLNPLTYLRVSRENLFFNLPEKRMSEKRVWTIEDNDSAFGAHNLVWFGEQQTIAPSLPTANSPTGKKSVALEAPDQKEFSSPMLPGTYAAGAVWYILGKGAYKRWKRGGEDRREVESQLRRELGLSEETLLKGKAFEDLLEKRDLKWKIELWFGPRRHEKHEIFKPDFLSSFHAILDPESTALRQKWWQYVRRARYVAPLSVGLLYIAGFVLNYAYALNNPLETVISFAVADLVALALWDQAPVLVHQLNNWIHPHALLTATGGSPDLYVTNALKVLDNDPVGAEKLTDHLFEMVDKVIADLAQAENWESALGRRSTRLRNAMLKPVPYARGKLPVDAYEGVDPRYSTGLLNQLLETALGQKPEDIELDPDAIALEEELRSLIPIADAARGRMDEIKKVYRAALAKRKAELYKEWATDLLRKLRDEHGEKADKALGMYLDGAERVIRKMKEKGEEGEKAPSAQGTINIDLPKSGNLLEDTIRTVHEGTDFVNWRTLIEISSDDKNKTLEILKDFVNTIINRAADVDKDALTGSTRNTLKSVLRHSSYAEENLKGLVAEIDRQNPPKAGASELRLKVKYAAETGKEPSAKLLSLMVQWVVKLPEETAVTFAGARKIYLDKTGEEPSDELWSKWMVILRSPAGQRNLADIAANSAKEHNATAEKKAQDKRLLIPTKSQVETFQAQWLDKEKPAPFDISQNFRDGVVWSIGQTIAAKWWTSNDVAYVRVYARIEKSPIESTPITKPIRLLDLVEDAGFNQFFIVSRNGAVPQSKAGAIYGEAFEASVFADEPSVQLDVLDDNGFPLETMKDRMTFRLIIKPTVKGQKVTGYTLKPDTPADAYFEKPANPPGHRSLSDFQREKQERKSAPAVEEKNVPSATAAPVVDTQAKEDAAYRNKVIDYFVTLMADNLGKRQYSDAIRHADEFIKKQQRDGEKFSNDGSLGTAIEQYARNTGLIAKWTKLRKSSYGSAYRASKFYSVVVAGFGEGKVVPQVLLWGYLHMRHLTQSPFIFALIFAVTATVIYVAIHIPQLYIGKEGKENKGKSFWQRFKTLATMDIMLNSALTFIVSFFLPNASPAHAQEALNLLAALHTAINVAGFLFFGRLWAAKEKLARGFSELDAVAATIGVAPGASDYFPTVEKVPNIFLSTLRGTRAALLAGRFSSQA